MTEEDSSGGQDTDVLVRESAMSKFWRLIGTPILTWDKPESKKKDWKICLTLLLILILLPQLIVWSVCSSARSNADPWPQYSNLRLSKEKQCDTVHLATICGGYQATGNFHVLLKSILFHRRAAYKIHYHLFVDKISSHILNKLNQTWPVPDLKLSFYNISDYESEVSWITNSHYSNHYGLLKLLVPSILAKKNVSQVILLDTDMIVLGDVKQIWSSFSNLDWSSFFGLVENQSDWYLSKKDTSSSHIRPNVWPAIGRGYNTGLMLIDVEKAMKRDWDKLWREVASTELVEHLYTSLADQDICNAVIKRHSRIVTKLPCNLNLQLNNHTNIERTCGEYNDATISVVHWNSPSKLKTDNAKAEYFKSWYLTFQDWNGKLLERDACPISKSEYSLDDYSWGEHSLWLSRILNPCFDYHPKPEEALRTLLYAKEFEFEESDKNSANNSITAVVHLTLDRLQSLEDLAAHWSGPISASIYMNDAETSLLLSSIEESKVLSKRKNIGYHLVFKTIGWHYPINRMRNIALDNVITPYVFLTDVDFLPAKNLHHHLQEIINTMSGDLFRKALVIPAFESRQYKLEFPENKKALIEQMDLGKISTFRHQEWPKGQEQTDYPKWKLATRSYPVEWRRDYEPYIVTTKDVRRFDERFIGFGWNKVEHSLVLAAEGYEFLVLPDAFIVHQDHAASLDLRAFRNDNGFQKCIDHLKRDVWEFIEKKYNQFYKKHYWYSSIYF